MGNRQTGKSALIGDFMKIKTQVCVLGAGAGGTGCVYQLIKNGILTVVVDKNPDFGGTAVFCGVDGWEPGASLDGMHQILKDELKKTHNASHVVEIVPNLNVLDSTAGPDWSKHSFEERPWGFSMAAKCNYEDTLKRCISLRGENGPKRRFQFEPECMTKAINDILMPFEDNLTRFFGYSYSSCTVEDNKIKSIVITDGNEKIEIFADFFVDASGDIVLARDAGCGYMFGTEGKEEFNEPSATKKSNSINAVSYVFRVAKIADKSHIDEIPDEYKTIDITEWKEKEMKNTFSCFTEYPNGDININMLPTMQGEEYYNYKENADIIGRARVYAYWNYLQKEKKMSGYTIKHIFDAGIRESYRLKGKYILKEQDLRAGKFEQSEQIIAIADHAMDIHGENGLAKELTVPYEIPVECTMTNEFSNLFVACRGASFTHIAASSARLTRTMLSIGEGVGEYISKKIF